MVAPYDVSKVRGLIQGAKRRGTRVSSHEEGGKAFQTQLKQVEFRAVSPQKVASGTADKAEGKQ